MVDKQAKCIKDSIIVLPPTTDSICAKMKEPDLRLIIDYMVLWDLSPRQIANIITGFDGLKANEKKVLVEYSKAVVKVNQQAVQNKKSVPDASSKAIPMSLCAKMH